MQRLFIPLLIPMYLFSMDGENKTKIAQPSRCATQCSECLHLVVQTGGNECIQSIKKLLDNGCSVDSQDKEGRTPLHITVTKHNLGVARFLVQDCKASVNTTDNNGRTPLELINVEMKKDKNRSCKVMLGCIKNLLKNNGALNN